MKTGFFSVIAVAMMTTSAVAQTQMWVTGDAANRRTCPSTECGVVGKLSFRESAKVAESRNGWGRVSKYYDASCVGGRSQYIDAGRADCVPENGMSTNSLRNGSSLTCCLRIVLRIPAQVPAVPQSW